MATENRPTQCSIILEHIAEHGEITQRDAFEYGIFRLASRIADLKKRGVPIKTRLIPFVTRHGVKSHIAAYSM